MAEPFDSALYVPQAAAALGLPRLNAKSDVYELVAVLDGARLVGVFSERDVVRRVVNRGRDPETTPVENVMTCEIVVASEDEDYQSAMRKIDQANIRHLPIVAGDRLVSMLSIRDLMRVDMARMSEEIASLHEYLYQVPK